MGLGVLCGLLAGALWGTVFVAPRWLGDFSPWELAFGRYVSYAAIAVVALAPTWRATWRKVGRTDAMAMVRQSCTGNLVYYVLLAYGVQLAGVSLTSLVIGLLPLAVTLVGRRDHGAVALRTLAPPLALVVVGMVCINVDLFLHGPTGLPGVPGWQRVAGVACAVAALGCWTAYAIDNARFLKRSPRFTSREWSALYGFTSGLLALGAGAAVWAVLAVAGPADVAERAPRSLERFWAISLFLALGASFVGNHLWNVASRLVPVTLSGQLIVFETLFALAYGFIDAGTAPRPLEIAAMVLLVVGVAWTVRLHAVDEPAH